MLLYMLYYYKNANSQHMTAFFLMTRQKTFMDFRRAFASVKTMRRRNPVRHSLLAGSAAIRYNQYCHGKKMHCDRKYFISVSPKDQSPERDIPEKVL